MRPTFKQLAKVNSLRVDPALNNYANMYVERHKYFRWTSRTARIGFMYVLAVPAAVCYLAYQTEGKYEMRGKRRGDIMSEF